MAAKSRRTAQLLLGVLLATQVGRAQGARPRNVTPPLVLHQHAAIYPPAELASKKHAEVVLVVTVDAQGHVAHREVAQSGGREFDDAAMVAMRDWTFVPAKRDGKPVSAKIRVPFHFVPPEASLGDELLAPGIQGSVAAGRSAESPQAGESASRDPSDPGRPAGVSERELVAAAEAESRDRPDEVRVLGRSHVPSRGAGDYDIAVGKLAAVPRMDSASLLRLAPGVLLTNEGGLGHPHQIFLRGFDAREGQDLEFSVDGIPINEVGNPHGNGLADTNFIIPELVSRLRVVEGPFAPQQGNFAVAGSALYDLGLDRPGLSAQARFGSFNTKRLLLLWRPDGASDHTFGGAELFETDGFGQNRGAKRATAMGSYEGALGRTGSYRVLVTSYATHYAQAGVLRVDDVDSGRKGFYDTYETALGGDAGRHSVGATLAGKLGRMRLVQSTFLVFRDFRLRQNFTGFQQDPMETWQSPHPQRGDLIDQRSSQVTFGGRGSARESWTVLGRKQELELGYFARADKVDGVQERDRSGTTVPYRTDLRLDSSIANLGLFADASLRPLPFLTLRGGLRGDLFHYRVTNRCALVTQSSFGGDPLDTECFASDRQGYRSPEQTTSTAATLLQPRATVLVGPVTGVTFSASYGHGARSLDPQYVNQDLDTPFSTVRAQEFGVAYQRSLADVDLTVRSVFFQTNVDRDLFFNQTEGRNTLASGTTRTGWAGNARATGRFFDVAANLTLVRGIFDDTKLVIPYAPGAIARADGVLFGDLPIALGGRKFEGSIGAGVSFIGARPLPLNERSQENWLVDAGATIRWRALTLGLIATNLLDRKYRLGEYNYASDFGSQPYPTRVPARHFTAGEPRAIFGTLTITLEGEGS